MKAAKRRAHHQEGSAKVAAALSLVDFPVAKKDIVKKAGEWSVPLGNGGVTTLKDLLKAVPEERFATPAEAINAVDLHWSELMGGPEPTARKRGGGKMARVKKSEEETRGVQE